MSSAVRKIATSESFPSSPLLPGPPVNPIIVVGTESIVTGVDPFLYLLKTLSTFPLLPHKTPFHPAIVAGAACSSLPNLPSLPGQLPPYLAIVANKPSEDWLERRPEAVAPPRRLLAAAGAAERIGPIVAAAAVVDVPNYCTF